MAIELLCPSCSAAIRVGDDAAGKQGKCPQCGTRILIPDVDVSAEAESSPAADPEPADIPDLGPSSSRLSNPAARRLRRQRKKKTKTRVKGRPSQAYRVLIPLLCGTALVGTVGWLYFNYFQEEPRLEGKLQAILLEDFEPAPAIVERSLVEGLPNETVDFVLESLADDPKPLLSAFMEVEFRGTDEGIQVSLRETAATRFFAVDIRKDPQLRQYNKGNARELNKPRRKELREAAEKFFRAWEQQENEDVPMDDLIGYRNRLGINSLIGGLGYSIEAVTGRTIYPCVHEDNDGLFYFLLPPETQSFKIQGRELPDGSQPFTGLYTVEVTAAVEE